MIFYRKWLLSIVTIIGISVIFFSGCATIKDEIYLQNVELEGTLSQLPVHVTDADMKKKKFYVSPHISVNTRKTYTTSNLGRRYGGQIPDSLRDFQRKGLQWNLPTLKFGLDIDYAVSDKVALMVGVASSTGKEGQFTGGYGGLGFYAADTTVGFRLDIGLQYAENLYRGASILVRTTTSYGGSSSQDVVYFVDRGRESHFNLFTNLTVNSSNRNWLFNYFIQIGLSPQTLTSFTPTEAITTYPFGVTHIVSDQRAESSVTWLSVVPGFYFPIGESRRIVLGVRFQSDISNIPESTEAGILLIPMVQFDWGL